MKLSKNLGFTLLAIWLIATGLISLLGLSFSGLGIVMGILALAAGALILFGGGSKISLSGNLGYLLLGIWLILEGLIALLSLGFNGLDLIMGILALAAGVLLILKR